MSDYYVAVNSFYHSATNVAGSGNILGEKKSTRYMIIFIIIIIFCFLTALIKFLVVEWAQNTSNWLTHHTGWNIASKCFSVCVCVCVCVCGALIQLYWLFFPGVEYGFLCVYNVMYFNIVVTVVCLLPLLCCPFWLMFLFVHSYCKARCADFCLRAIQLSIIIIIYY